MFSPTIITLPGENLITVCNRGYTDLAKSVAEAYEKSGEEEFTIAEDY